MSKLKHINIKNNNFVLTEEPKGKVDKLKLMESSTKNLNNSFNWIFNKNNTINFTNSKNNQKSVVFATMLKSSGKEDNFSKRIHVPKNAYNDEVMPVGIYDAGDKFIYVYFSDHRILKNTNEFHKSVWVNFAALSLVIENSKDMKYSNNLKEFNEKYFIYITDDMQKILNKNFEDFEEISKDILNCKIEFIKEKYYEILKTNFSNVLFTLFRDFLNSNNFYIIINFV